MTHEACKMPSSFISHIGFGCAALTGEPTQERALRLLETAYDVGIRHFDTAPGYGAGYSERLLGGFLRGKREKTIVATKIGFGQSVSTLPPWLVLPLNCARRKLSGRRAPQARNPSPPLLTPRRISRDVVEASVTQSLRSLKTERIDILLLHEALPSFLDAKAQDYLISLQHRGVVGLLGVATHGSNYLSLQPTDLIGWDVLQYEYGPEWPRHAQLPAQFPTQRQVLHSCLGSRCSAGLSAGKLLAEVLHAVPSAIVLFSSRQPMHIRDNVREAEAAWHA